MGSVRENLHTALKWSVIYVAVYSGIVLVIALTQGAGPFARSDTSLTKVLAAYWVGGLGAGVLVGLLLPLGRSMLGAAFIGAIAAIPVACAATLAITPPEHWASTLPVGIGFGVLVGPLFGIATKLQDGHR